MSHQVIIIRGNVQTGQQEIEVTYEPPDELSGNEARKEASRWVKWVKSSYEHEEDS